jgi:glycyl-tRNA synthetase beta chain
LVIEGNEKVLAARLSDARFFWDEDREQSLEAYLPKLDKVVFQEKLGSLRDKTRRVEALSGWLAEALGADEDTKATAARGARLAKADLVTGMVFEFGELQGIMGRYYALERGEKPGVAAVIAEHYQPRFAGDRLADSEAGAIVAIADKMDTIAGIFSIGVEPSGSQDPYAIRRAAMGVCQTLLARRTRISLSALIRRSLAGYGLVYGMPDAGDDAMTGVNDDERRSAGDIAEKEPNTLTTKESKAHARAVYDRIWEFFTARIKGVLADEGHRYDVIDCALGAGFDEIQEVMERARAISLLRHDERFNNLLAGFTRAYNLTKKSVRPIDMDPGRGAPKEVDDFDKTVNPAMLMEEAEMALHAQILATKVAIGDVLAREGHIGVISALSNIAAPVNAFFDAVMVLVEDSALQANRLGLLREVVRLTRLAGDLSKLQE